MVLIKPCKGLIAVVFCLVLGAYAFPQANSASLASEIAALEKKASNTKLSPAERKQSLEKWARLLELSGNAGEAAEVWGKAALAGSGSIDLWAMLQGARCLAAIGEFDRAAAALKPVMGASGTLLVQARLLDAWIDAFKTGTITALNALLSNPDFAGCKPGIYYTIWRITGDPTVKTAMASRLLAEFPQSPETRIIRDDPTVSAVPAALWLLSVFNQADLIASQPTPTEQGQPVTGQSQPEAGQSAAENSGGPVLLQTGLFSREDNARLLGERLRKAGFNPVVSPKTVNGEIYWVVGVTPGPDPNRTMLLLRDSGFESFPVF